MATVVAPEPESTDAAARPALSAKDAPLHSAEESTTARRVVRPRLEHVDAMRPIKQFGVVSTHSFAFFAPATGVAVGASVLVTHVTRFAFIFISAAMLVYAYPRLDRGGIRIFWRRRLVAVALPYLAWTLIYFAAEADSFHSWGQAIGRLAYLVGTGYYQLYYLLLLLELCLVYPGLLYLLRKTEKHHRELFVGSLLLQLILMSCTHWGLFAGGLGKGNGMLELWNYELFVIAGGILAWHYEVLHAYLLEHTRQILLATLASGLLAEGWIVLAEQRIVPALSGTNPAAVFQPIVMPFYLGLVTCTYLLGMQLASHRHSRRFRSAVRVGVDDSYGIYLSQLLMFQALVFFGYKNLLHYLPWPVVTVLGIVIVFFSATAFTSFLARLPGARALAGRPRQAWRGLWPPYLRRQARLEGAAEAV